MEKQFKSIINQLEANRIKINPDWFYHGAPFIEENFKDILLHGIKCSKLLHTSAVGINGDYYISISKRTQGENSAFTLYQTRYPLFILENVHAIPTSKKYFFLTSTPFPLRYSDYKDEWQAFLKIQPEKIVGIEYALYLLLKQNERNRETILETLQKLVLLLQEIHISLPIYDFSTKREIDQSKVLQWTKKF